MTELECTLGTHSRALSHGYLDSGAHRYTTEWPAPDFKPEPSTQSEGLHRLPEKRRVPNGLWAALVASVILIIGPGAIGEIRGVTEFEMPPGPQIARAIAAHSSALKRSSHHAWYVSRGTTSPRRQSGPRAVYVVGVPSRYRFSCRVRADGESLVRRPS